MKCLNPMRRALLALFLLAGLAGGAQAAGALASGSLYQSDVTLTDQNGRTFHLADLRGQPVQISMFYSSCQMV
jgi:protein SCO1/2